MEVYELAAGQFGAAAGLYAAAWFDEAVIGAALEGRQSARLFVDAAGRPGGAVLCHRYDDYLAGEPAPALRRFIADAPEEAGVFGQVYGFCPLNRAWQEALLADAGGGLEVIPRRNFKYHRRSPPPLEDRAAIWPIDRDLAERVDREFQRAISRTWGDIDSFLAGAFGFCALAGDTIASIAHGAAISAAYADLGVETAAAFRRQGYAYRACAAFVAECLRRALLPCWAADGPNLASAALAEKLGFKEEAGFSELAVPGRGPLPLTQGRWQGHGLAVGGTLWVRQPGVAAANPNRGL